MELEKKKNVWGICVGSNKTGGGGCGVVRGEGVVVPWVPGATLMKPSSAT